MITYRICSIIYYNEEVKNCPTLTDYVDYIETTIRDDYLAPLEEKFNAVECWKEQPLYGEPELSDEEFENILKKREERCSAVNSDVISKAKDSCRNILDCLRDIIKWVDSIRKSGLLSKDPAGGETQDKGQTLPAADKNSEQLRVNTQNCIELSKPMPKSQMMRVLKIDGQDKFNSWAKEHGLKRINRKTFQICLDNMSEKEKILLKKT
jgi:hypothetical protein